MDLRKYGEKKEKGLVEVLPVGKAHALVSKRFDADTGVELDDEVITVNKEHLTKQRDEMQKDLASLNALLDDMETIKPSNNASSPA